MSQRIKNSWIIIVTVAFIVAMFLGSGVYKKRVSYHELPQSSPIPKIVASETRHCIRESEWIDTLNQLAVARGRIAYLEKELYPPKETPVFIGFNYKGQMDQIKTAKRKGGKVELLFRFSLERGQAWSENNYRVARCWLNYETAQSYIEKEIAIEIKIPISRCRELIP